MLDFDRDPIRLSVMKDLKKITGLEFHVLQSHSSRIDTVEFRNASLCEIRQFKGNSDRGESLYGHANEIIKNIEGGELVTNLKKSHEEEIKVLNEQITELKEYKVFYEKFKGLVTINLPPEDKQ